MTAKSARKDSVIKQREEKAAAQKVLEANIRKAYGEGETWKDLCKYFGVSNRMIGFALRHGRTTLQDTPGIFYGRKTTKKLRRENRELKALLENNHFDLSAHLNEARRLAVKAVPPEDGFFDGIDRAKVFVGLLTQQSLVVSYGEIDEKEAGRLIEAYNLYAVDAH